MKQKRKAPGVPGVVENEDGQAQFEGEDDGEDPLLQYSSREEHIKVAKVAEKEERRSNQKERSRQ